MILALSNQGLVRFGFHDDAIDAERFTGFMADSVHDRPAKIFLVVDRLPMHRAGKVSRWMAKHKERMELFYLPPYSPQMNPDEWFNRDLKCTKDS